VIGEIRGVLNVSAATVCDAGKGVPTIWCFRVSADIDDDAPGVFLEGQGTSLFLSTEAAQLLLAEIETALASLSKTATE
jgi:hypothetical protein